MIDTSNVDASPDAQPISQPSARGQAVQRLLDDWNGSQGAQQGTGVWQRGTDQPTTVGGFQLPGQPPRPPPQPPRPQPPPPNPMSGAWQPGPKSPFARLNQVPPGTRLPPPPMWQRYMPPLPNRPSSQWGQPEPFPTLPQTFELPGLFQNIGQFFGQNGSSSVAPLGLLSSAFSGAYQKGVIAGNEALMKLARERMDLANAQLEENVQRQLSEYSDVMAEYEAASGQTDPDKVGGLAIGGKSLHQAMEDKARELNDGPLLGLLSSGAPMSKVEQYLQAHEAKWRALHAANKKSAQDSAEDTLWGQSGTAGAPAGEGISGIQEGLPTTQPETATTPAAKPELTGDEKPDITGFAPSNPLHQKVMDGVQGTLDTTGLDKAPATKVAVSKGIDAVNSRLDAIANDHNLSSDQVMEKVKEISPEFADHLKNVVEYRRPIAGIAGGGSPKEMAYNSRLTRLAERVKPADPSKNQPGWNQSTYKAVQDFRDESQKQNNPIQRIPTSVAAGQQVLNDLKLIQARDGTQADTSLASLTGAMKLDPLYQKLRADWLNYIEDISVLTIGPQVGLTKMGEADIPWYGTPETYREVVKSHMGVAESKVNQLHNQWDSYGTGDPMPGYSPQAEKDMNSIRNMDPTSGLLPGQPLKDSTGKTIAIYTGKNPSNPNADENWDPQ